ncbi:hypothetical protein CL647_03130 [bacterium]|nr:hypothetical protein [bacterium]
MSKSKNISSLENFKKFSFFNETMLIVLNENKRESQQTNQLTTLRNFVKPMDNISEQVKNINNQQALKTMFRMGLNFHEIKLRVISSLNTLPRETLEILAEKNSFDSIYKDIIKPLQESIESRSLKTIYL